MLSGINFIDILTLGLFLFFTNIFLVMELSSYRFEFRYKYSIKAFAVVNLATIGYWFFAQVIHFQLPRILGYLILVLGFLLAPFLALARKKIKNIETSEYPLCGFLAAFFLWLSLWVLRDVCIFSEEGLWSETFLLFMLLGFAGIIVTRIKNYKYLG